MFVCLGAYVLVGLCLYFDSAGFTFGCVVVHIGCVLLLVSWAWVLVGLWAWYCVCLCFTLFVFYAVWVLDLAVVSLFSCCCCL